MTAIYGCLGSGLPGRELIAVIVILLVKLGKCEVVGLIDLAVPIILI